MESQRYRATRESPEQQGVDEGRLMIERAERTVDKDKAVEVAGDPGKVDDQLSVKPK